MKSKRDIREVSYKAQKRSNLARPRVKLPEFRETNDGTLEETLVSFFREKGKLNERCDQPIQITKTIAPMPIRIIEENVDKESLNSDKNGLPSILSSVNQSIEQLDYIPRVYKNPDLDE